MPLQSETIEYILTELREAQKQLTIEVNALKTWRTSVETLAAEKRKEIEAEGVPQRDWVKIVIYVLTLALGLLGLITSGKVNVG